MRRMWRASRPTRLLLVVTFSSALVLPLEWAVLVGAGLGLVIHLAKTSIPRLTLLQPVGDWLLPLEPGAAADVVVVEVSGDLHYAAVDPFLDELESMLPRGARAVVIDLSHAHEMRFTALRALERFAAEWSRRNVRVLLAGVDPAVQEMLVRSGSRLAATPAEPEPFRSVWRCIQAYVVEDDAVSTLEER